MRKLEILIDPSEPLTLRKKVKRLILKAILIFAKYSGFFSLCQKLTSADLRILCYHGAELVDESVYSPGLFLTAETFARRLQYLARKGYPVLPLEQSIHRLKAGTLPKCAVAITIDDGWFGTYKHFYPELSRHDFAATLYITSYYLETQTQVFNVAASYALWKSNCEMIDLAALNCGLEGKFDLARSQERQAVMAILIPTANQLGAAERQNLLHDIYTLVDIDGKKLETERAFSFVTQEEAKEMLEHGIDCQLHTHRHRFPVADPTTARQEILDNRASLAAITDKNLTHFCYPDGVYRSCQTAVLKDLGIESATTTEFGFNQRDADVYELTRFLDSERISNIEFEAEMSGFFEMIRRFGFRI